MAYSNKNTNIAACFIQFCSSRKSRDVSLFAIDGGVDRDSRLQGTNCLIILSLLPRLPTPTYVSTPCIRCCDHNPVRNNDCSLCYSVLFIEKKLRCFLFTFVEGVEIRDYNIQFA